MPVPEHNVVEEKTMPRRNVSDESKLVEIIKRLPFKKKDIKQWVATIEDSGLNEELAKELRTAIAALPRSEDDQGRSHARDAMELGKIIQRWRLTQNIRSFNQRNR